MESLPGFRDFEPSACAQRNALFHGWRTVARRFGFEEFDGPIAEPLELFTQKSGEEIVNQLFAFEDKGGRKMALRPEMTPSLVRILGKNLATLKKPTKLFNITEQFRYERPQKGRLRSFYQFNADIVGEPSLSAEGELIALAVESLRYFGLTEEHFYVRLSDRQLWQLWLKAFGITDEVLVGGVLGLLDKWERRPKEDIEADLAKLLPSSVQAKTFFDATEQLRQCKILEAIEACFSQQATDAELSEALRQRLAEFEKLLHELSALGCEKFVAVDLTIVRGLAYYTGFVFEVFETGNQGRALAGGGRYDQLFEKLTRHPMPAVGFAAGDVTLTDLLNKYHLLPEYKRKIDVFCVFEETERDRALRCIQILRCENFSVLYPFGEAKVLSKQLKKAYAEQPRYVLIFTQELSSRGKVQVKCFADETTREVVLGEVAEVLKEERKSEA